MEDDLASNICQARAPGGFIFLNGGEGEGNVGASGGGLTLIGGGSASLQGCGDGVYTCAGQLVSVVVYKAGGLLRTSTRPTSNLLLLLRTSM